jgi:hypothetical protein
MNYEFEQRTKFGKYAEQKMKERHHDNETNSFDHWTDKELITKLLEEESLEKAYENDRR